MKNFDETINSVFSRIHKYEVGKNHKRQIITRTLTALCCFCLVALLGIGVRQSHLSHTRPPAVPDGDSASLRGTDQSEETTPHDTAPEDVIPSAPVIWGDAHGELQDMGFIQWNGKTVTVSLYDILSDEKSKNSLIAIDVGFELDDQFVYNGKTLAEYAAEADQEELRHGKLGLLLKLGDSLKYGDALYKTGTPAGEKWAKEYYEETVEKIGKDLIAQYIVDGAFLKEKLEADLANGNEAEPCRIACEAARKAYYQFVVDAAIEQLGQRNIRCGRRSATGIMIYAGADQLASLQLDHVLFYGLALKDGEGMDMSEY